MIEARTLPEALARWAAAAPEQPWLFHPQSPQSFDWRWYSFAEIAFGMARHAEALAAAAPTGAESVAFDARPSPEGVALDLAAQDLGWTARPGRAGPPVVLPGEVGVQLPALERRRSGRRPEVAPARLGAGGAVVRDDGGERRLDAAEMLALAVSLGGSLPAPAGRDVLVLHRPLDEPGGRALLAWATLAGAALLLQPDPTQLAASVLWSRPTLMAGAVAELAGVREALRRHEPRRERWRRPRGPLGRLRAVIALDADAGWPAAAEAGVWRDLEVSVVAAPGRRAAVAAR